MCPCINEVQFRGAILGWNIDKIAYTTFFGF
jgi:hypothetical protein